MLYYYPIPSPFPTFPSIFSLAHIPIVILMEIVTGRKIGTLTTILCSIHILLYDKNLCRYF